MKFEKLGNIIQIQKGKKPSFVDSPNKDSVRVLQIDDLRNDDTPKFTNDRTGVYAESEDILLAWDGANAGTIGYGKPGYIGSTIALLRKRQPELYSTVFIGLFLQSKYQYLHDKATGATIPHISRRALENLLIPVIDIKDQFHIADILTKAIDLIVQRKESIRLLDEYLKSAFLEMFYSNPDKIFWDELMFEELAEKKKGSMRTGPFGSDLLHGEFTEQGDVKVLGIDNVVSNRFEWNRIRCITFEKFQELKRYQIYPNDVLISIMATLGRTAVVPIDISNCINSKHLAAITLNKELANPYFIAYAFHSHPQIVSQIGSNIKGAIMDGLNLTIIKRIKIKRPPIALQNKFGELFEKTAALKTHYQQGLQELESLYGSLSQRAFRGELTTELCF